MNTAGCTVSGSPTASPIHAENAVSAIPKSTMTMTMPTAPATPVWNRNPIASDAATSSSDWSPSRKLSLAVRPTRKAERAIGSTRNRSIIPDCRSYAMPTPDAHRRERHRLDEHRGDDEVLVADPLAEVDDRGEHVGEQDQLHERLDRGEDDQPGVAQHAP